MADNKRKRNGDDEESRPGKPDAQPLEGDSDPQPPPPPPPPGETSGGGKQG